jgi:hypothetical protein
MSSQEKNNHISILYQPEIMYLKNKIDPLPSHNQILKEQFFLSERNVQL